MTLARLRRMTSLRFDDKMTSGRGAQRRH